MAFCNKCGTKISEDALVCANCAGHSAASPVPGVISPAAPRRSLVRPVLWTLAGLVVVAVFVAGLGIFKGAEQGAREGVAKNLGHDEDIKSIRAVLKQDRALSDAMNRTIDQTKINTPDDFDKIAEAIKGYLDDANHIDTQFCPRDFAEAYYRHLSAYSNEAEAVRSHPDMPSGEEAFANGFYRGLAGDPTGGAVQMQDEMQAWRKEVQGKNADVQKTWQEVEALAIRYGA